MEHPTDRLFLFTVEIYVLVPCTSLLSLRLELITLSVIYHYHSLVLR